MAECEKRLNLPGVVPAVANEYALAVFEVHYVGTFATCAGICAEGVSAVIGKCHRECEGQLARGVGLAEKNIGYGVAGFRAEEPGLDNGRYFLYPRHCHGVSAHIYHDCAWIGGGEGLYHGVLSVRQAEGGTVGVLAVLSGALVQTAHKHHVVGIARLFHGFRYKLCRSAAVGEILAGCHTVVFAAHVAHIAAGVIYRRHSCGRVAYAVERRNLALYLQRR